MIDILKKYKFAVIGILVIAGGFWAYSVYGPQIGGILETPIEPIGQELFTTLRLLEGITLNEALFGDADFQRLQDYETQVPVGFAGRENPFSLPGFDIGGRLRDPSVIVENVSPAETFLQVPEVSTSTPETTE